MLDRTRRRVTLLNWKPHQNWLETTFLRWNIWNRLDNNTCCAPSLDSFMSWLELLHKVSHFLDFARLFDCRGREPVHWGLGKTQSVKLRMIERVQTVTWRTLTLRRLRQHIQRPRCVGGIDCRLHELTARVNGPSWRVTGFHYRSTWAVLTSARFH